MSAVELAIEKVKALDEQQALKLIQWLESSQPAPHPSDPLGARAMLGFARRFRSQVRATADWLAELREGEGR